MKIGLVSCSAQKLDHAAPARELYCSPLFRASLRLAEHDCDKVYILSALHHLVDLDCVIEPYDRVLSKMPKRARHVWGDHVADRILSRHDRHDPIVLFAGYDYVMAVRHGMGGTDQARISDPFKGMMIGERLSFLRRHAPLEVV